jgi:YD repeat-containing protein
MSWVSVAARRWASAAVNGDAAENLQSIASSNANGAAMSYTYHGLNLLSDQRRSGDDKLHL